MNEDRLQNETWLTVKEDVFPIDYGDFSLLWYFTKGVIHVTPVVTPLFQVGETLVTGDTLLVRDFPILKLASFQ